MKSATKLIARAVLLAAALVQCSTAEELEIGADGSRAAERTLPEVPADAKFILYDVGFGERFNFRKSVFRRVMGTVDVLSKHAADLGTWVLVLPPFRDVVRGMESFAPFSDFMRLDKLRELYPHVIDFHDYVAIRGNRVSHILMPVNDHKLENVRDESCAPAVEKASRRIDMDAHTVEHFNVQLKFDSLQCVWSFGARSVEMKDAIRAAVTKGSADSILIEAVEQVRPAESSKHPYWAYRQHMHFAQHLHAEAAKFRAGFDDPSGPYIAMHMRRGDFKNAHAKTQSSQDDIVARFAAMADKHDIQQFFVATDADDGEVQSMKQTLRQQHGITLYKIARSDLTLPNDEAKGSLGFMLVEQIVAAQADIFIGTHGSHFSKEIHLERRLNQGGKKHLENSWSMVEKGELVPLCDSWEVGERCEILPFD